jgi:hypothetical protein
MPSQLLTYAAGHVAWILLVLGIAISLKALASVARTWIEQAACTRRLGKALEGARPSQRPEIILACSRLEGRAVGEPDSDVTDEAVGALASPRLKVPIPHGKPGRKRRG